MLDLVSPHPHIISLYDSYFDVDYHSIRGDFKTHVLVLESCLWSMLEYDVFSYLLSPLMIIT